MMQTSYFHQKIPGSRDRPRYGLIYNVMPQQKAAESRYLKHEHKRQGNKQHSKCGNALHYKVLFHVVPSPYSVLNVYENFLACKI